ncbi:MAG TPA: 5-deoxy-glucuronate isomerase [Candidatus Limnocylindrales bacterium]|nr:5-deoxy-glucuronate isomerase [Candidatus Limnocylindrales bacterium]
MTGAVVHPRALPNTLSAEELRIRPADRDRPELAVDPSRAGWRYLSFRVTALGAGDEMAVGSDGLETAVVVLGGGGASVVPEAAPPLELPGRESVFEALPWAAWLPPGTRARIASQPRQDGGAVHLALAQAPASGRSGVAETPIRIGPDDVRVEVRGAGNATRQINHIIAPDFPADRLLLVEVFTPAGNWSSWPPHKHDVDAMPAEAVLEEVYHYRLRRPEGWAIQRLYRGDGSRDALWAVAHGDLVLVTDGYHPFAAAHGYDAYYLNALAGDRRTMACSFDPDLDWTRAAWSGMETDPRVPLVRPAGWPRAIDR